MRRNWIAVIAAAVLGLGVVGAVGTRAGAYLSHVAGGHSPVAAQTSSTATSGGGQGTSQASVGQSLTGQPGEEGGQGGGD